MKKVLSILIITIVFFSYQEIVTTTYYDINSPEVHEIAEQLSMQGHEIHDLATCLTKQMYYEHIAELLNEGETKEEILEYYYSMYGEEGLRAPKKEGFSLLAWVTPFLVLSFAGVALFVGVKRMVNRNEKLDFNNEPEDIDKEVENEIVKSMIDEERKRHF